MHSFPTEKLKPQVGILAGQSGDVSIEIGLEPFELAEIAEPISTSLRLEGINLPTVFAVELSGRSFEFPLNPTAGYIDGSIYIEHAHHPADVSRIVFGQYRDEVLDVEIELNLAFEFEGLEDYSNTDWICRAQLQCE